jgi:N,N'-diacetyllegionaminate synthase
MKTFVIAEAGVNHNGNADLALELVDVAARCGADAVKFQSFKAEKLVRPGAEKVDYQKRETGEGDQFDMLKKLEMSEDVHRRLINRCQDVGIEFMSTPFDEQAADFLVDLGMKRIKVPSGEITNHPFLEALAAKNIPLIISTGMASMEEVREAVEVVRAKREQLGYRGDLAEYITLLHCTSNYPAALEDVNLRAMNSMAEATGLPIGYSDHTLGIIVSVASVALGATIVEKHFTLDKNMEGPDHKASLEPAELQLMIEQIRSVEAMLGSATKAPTQSEMQVRALVRRSVTSVTRIAKGEPLTLDNATLLRPGTGIAPRDFAGVLGRKLKHDIEPGKTISAEDLE